ncbi:MAG: FimB/Mfa2 family fimbrial subunit [Tannerellaceae bacterium]|nr:FimB/Mfa2 family fimbrial subunit [Tannerellaceae bacterium]
MGKLQQPGTHIVLILAILAGMLGIQSCIREDFSNCFVDEDFLLYVKVVDILNGQDITESGALENACLYIFDQNELLLKIVYISASQIAAREPVVLHKKEAESMFISAWGNLTDKVSISGENGSGKLKDFTLSLLPDKENKNYDSAPGNLFFGTKQIVSQGNANSSDEIILTQKNAKLHITIRGLENPEDNYYFKIVNSHNGYNFTGFPTSKTSQLKGSGVFNSNSDYVSGQPHLLIHSVPGMQGDDDNIWVYIYREQTGQNIEIAYTNKDNSGNYIQLISGQTTNVLIELKTNGHLNVFIKTTPWDKIYQWEEY